MEGKKPTKNHCYNKKTIHCALFYVLIESFIGWWIYLLSHLLASGLLVAIEFRGSNHSRLVL